MKRFLKWIAVFIFGIAVPSHAALLSFTNIAPTARVINGSFEKGMDPGVSANLTAPDATTIRGWTVEEGTVDYIGPRWVAGDGARCLDLTGLSAGTISQTIRRLRIGRQYRLSFLIAGNPEVGGGTKSLLASIGSASEVFSFDGTGFNTEQMGWSLRTLDFVATGTTLKLSFTSLDDGLYGPALDAVRMERLVTRSRRSVSAVP